MIFSSAPFASTPFSSKVDTGLATILGSGAVALTLSVSGVGDHFDVPTVNGIGSITVSMPATGSGFAAVSCQGSAVISPVVTSVAAHGVAGVGGQAVIDLDVYGRSYAIFGNGAITIKPKANGISLAQVYAESAAITYALDVVGEGSIPAAYSASGSPTLAINTSGAGSHGVRGVGSANISPTGNGLGYRGVAGIGASTYSLNVRSRSLHSPVYAPQVSGFGAMTILPAISGVGAVGVRGSGASTIKLQATGHNLIPTGRGVAFAGLFVSGAGSYTQPISGSARIIMCPTVSASGTANVNPAFIVGGNRNPFNLIISGSGHHA